MDRTSAGGSSLGSRLRSVPLFVPVLLVFGILCCYAAVGVWLGVDQAVTGARTAGTVRDIHCGITRRSACSGTFTSNDGQVRNLKVTVSDTRRSSAGPIPSTLVRKIDTGLVGSIQSEDTAYPHGVSISVAGSVVIGVLLTLVGLAIMVPFLVIGLLLAMGKRPRDRAVPRRPT